MPAVPCFHVDAFASRPFGGNPAAVCLLAGSRPVRWFTPRTEVAARSRSGAAS